MRRVACSMTARTTSRVLVRVLVSKKSAGEEGVRLAAQEGGPGEVVAVGCGPGLRQSLVIMAGWCGDSPGLALSCPGW
jgi:hypothetical protein